MESSEGNEDLKASAAGATAPLVYLNHPRYGRWLRLAGGSLFSCAAGLSLIFVDLLKRLSLTTGIHFVDRALPFIIGLSLALIIAACAVVIGIERTRRRPVSRMGQKTWSLSSARKVELAILALGLIVAGVRVAKTLEGQQAKRRDAVAAARKHYEARMDAWRASDEGKEYARAKAQIRELRAEGGELIQEGRRRSHPKKRRDGAALLATANAIDLTPLEKTMPRPVAADVVAPVLPWWKFANIVVWPALLELVAIELMVLAIAFWASRAFATVGAPEEADDDWREAPDEEAATERDHHAAPRLRLLPDTMHPVFSCLDIEALESAFENEPDVAEADAWQEAKHGLDLQAATWRGLEITAQAHLTKRVGTSRRRFVWPVLVVSDGRTLFIGTQAALRYVSKTYTYHHPDTKQRG